MARPLRIEYAGAFYHITSRGNERRPIFRAAKDRSKFLSFLDEGANRYGLSIHAFCLMENHYHLLLETSVPNLSRAMHFINGGYTNYFNRLYQRAGHLFQGRFRAVLVEKDRYALALSRYIHLNPVRAGLFSRPEGYRWSSLRGYLDSRRKPSWLQTGWVLQQFHREEKEAQGRYKRFVEEGLVGGAPNPLQEAFSGLILGADQFVKWVQDSLLPKTKVERDLPALRKLRRNPSLAEVKESVERILGPDHRWARDVSLYLSVRSTGKALKAVGEFHGGLGESAVSQAVRRLKDRREKDRNLREEIGRVEEELEKLSRV